MSNYSELDELEKYLYYVLQPMTGWKTKKNTWLIVLKCAL